MRDFVLGVLSSVVATTLTLAAGLLGSRTVRRWPLRLMSRLTGLGVLRTYPSQRAANDDLGVELGRARWIKVLAGRGNELTRDAFAAVWQEAGVRLDSVQVLLPNPDAGAHSWLAVREAEIMRFDAGHVDGVSADQVRGNVEYLATVAAQRGPVELRLCDLPVVCRVIATDRVVYFTTYTASQHGRNAPCQVYSYGSPMYEFALHFFSLAWEKGIPARGART